MLKVVGASWFKTRVSTYLILGTLLLAVCAFFIADIEQTEFDGTYCATAYYSSATGFRTEFWGQVLDIESVPKGVARVCFRDTTFENGWSQLEIETQASYPDRIQAHAAGLLEGALTWSYIHSHWSNTVQSFCDAEENVSFCKWLRIFLHDNYNSTTDGINSHGNQATQDHYKYQSRLFYYQIEGLEHGFRKGVKRSRSDWEIDFDDFLLMNSVSDIRDFRVYYDTHVLKTNRNVNEYDGEKITVRMENIRPSMILKLVPQNDTMKIMFGHTSISNYSTMNRIIKKYKLNYHLSSAHHSQVIPGNEIEFTGYPGVVSSLDDFYIVSGKHTHLTVGGVEMKHKRISLPQAEFVNCVFMSARVMTANRLSHSGRTWARIMSLHPVSGSKQWILVDNKRLQYTRTPKTESDRSSDESNSKANEIDNNSIEDDRWRKNIILPKGTIWVIDQVPGRLIGEDETKMIVNQGYWLGTGIPHFNETLNKSGLLVIKNVPKISESIKLEEHVTELSDILKYFKQNALRGDLLPDDQKLAYGNIDVKLYSTTNIGDAVFETISGPMYNEYKDVEDDDDEDGALHITTRSSETSDDSASFRKILIRDDMKKIAMMQKSKPFRWSSSSLDVDHFGQPDIWNFKIFTPKWSTWSTKLLPSSISS